jgi:hypothetical protein
MGDDLSVVISKSDCSTSYQTAASSNSACAAFRNTNGNVMA